MIIFASLKTLTFDWAVLCKEKLAARAFIALICLVISILFSMVEGD